MIIGCIVRITRRYKHNVKTRYTRTILFDNIYYVYPLCAAARFRYKSVFAATLSFRNDKLYIILYCIFLVSILSRPYYKSARSAWSLLNARRETFDGRVESPEYGKTYTYRKIQESKSKYEFIYQ